MERLKSGDIMAWAGHVDGTNKYIDVGIEEEEDGYRLLGIDFNVQGKVCRIFIDNKILMDNKKLPLLSGSKNIFSPNGD